MRGKSAGVQLLHGGVTCSQDGAVWPACAWLDTSRFRVDGLMRASCARFLHAFDRFGPAPHVAQIGHQVHKARSGIVRRVRLRLR
jgi:hypothetical protein